MIVWQSEVPGFNPRRGLDLDTHLNFQSLCDLPVIYSPLRKTIRDVPYPKKHFLARQAEDPRTYTN